MAAFKAANTIKKRMMNHAAKLFKVSIGKIEFRNGLILSGNKSITFKELAFSCWENRISLSSTGFYKTPKISWDQEKFTGSPYFYFTWGAAISEAIIDIDTGESRILKADIVQDCGTSLNPVIDKGQIEGGFVQGLGWLTCEELYFNNKGKLMTLGPSTYKIPGSRDIPPEFNIKLLDKSPNDEATIFKSKAVGEPPLILSIAHFLALKKAIAASNEKANPDILTVPATPSKILAAITNNYSK
jgi:xanthine dehydrogenase large subunit